MSIHRTALLPARADARGRTTEETWGLVLDLVKNPDFIAVCAFAVVGLLVSASLMILFPLSAAEFLAGFL